MRKLLIIFTAFLFFACEKQSKTELRIAQGNAFGSTYGIQYYSDKDLDEEIAQALQFFDDKISTYREDTDIAKFNASEKGEKVDSVVLDLWKKCKEYSEKTNGYFDPTVQPLSNLYGFKKSKIHNKPTQQQIDSVLEFIGINKTYIQNDSILKTNPNTQLVFNAITGYINDYVSILLEKEGVKDYLIEIGGEIRAKGKKADGTNWVVGVDVPKEGDTNQELFTTLELNNESLATSGNYRKFHVLDNGDKVVHTMNPITGETGISKLLSATVVTPTTAEADATATALMAMGLEKAQQFAENHKDLKILLIWTDDKGEYLSKKYNGFGSLKQN
ncbi:FAD:protein FMN transferase [Weeksellaceae bacterium TAE3-ERU29]|nr:FAD:protein FMN transferase [Weeksellaceae bacterium TAE3-ERU29]